MARFALALFFALTLARAQDAESRRMQPDHAPTPFSPEEIRKACPEGRVDVYRIEDAEGQVVTRTVTFVKCDAEGASMEAAHADAEGNDLGTKTGYGTWKQFQSHASFPEKQVKITEETIETPAGKFECWLYTVTMERAGRTEVIRMYFARKLPGPPVKFTTAVDGKILDSMTLVEHRMPEAKAAPAD